MSKFIKVTDTSNDKKPPQIGYHDVDEDFVLPLETATTKFEFVDEKEAKENHPALFGIAPVAVEAAPKDAKGAKKEEEVKS